MKSVLVIGMGRFGRHLARKMAELNNEVMAIDKDEDVVDRIAQDYTDIRIGDCANEAVLKSLGVRNFDICFVAIGSDFQASLEITSLLKDLGAKYVVSKTRRDKQAKFLLKNGADEVIYPEKDIAEKLAVRMSRKNVFDFIELTPEYSIYEVPILESWKGKSMNDIDIRRKYHINILAIKHNTDLNPLPSADYTFKEGDHVVVLGKTSDINHLTSKS